MKPLDYKSAGVDLDAAQWLVKSVRSIARKTLRPEVMSDIGGFGALFSIQKEAFRDPVLVSSTDGVGTKLKVAFMANRHDTVGIDLVAMCANDVVVQGAEPLFFLDYLAVGKLERGVAEQILQGVASGCVEAGCALIGGETAELPDMYTPGEYDLAGFCVGAVDRGAIVDGSSISIGDCVIGISSSGLHANGFSLVRKLLFERLKLKIDQEIPGLGKTCCEELLTPTRIYVKTVINLCRDFPVKGLAHITGGGITENLSRILPNSCKAVVHKNSWRPHPIFEFIRQRGRIRDEEMLRVFNNGLGLMLVAPARRADEIMQRLDALGESAFIVGEIQDRKPGEPKIEYL